MIYLSIHVPAACSYLPPLRGALKVACGHSTTALKLPLSRHPATIARCKVSSAPGERLLRRLAGGALEAAPVPPRHPGEPHPGQLPAERNCRLAGALAKSMLHPPTPTHAASIHRRRAGRARRALGAPLDHARTHCRHARVHVRTHTCGVPLTHWYPPQASLMHSRTRRPASAPRPPLPLHRPRRESHTHALPSRARPRAHSQVRGPNPRVVHPPASLTR